LVVTGDKQLDRKLAQFEPKLQRKGVAKASRAGAKLVAARATARAPVDSGDLERSIRVRALRRSRVRSGHGVDSGSKTKHEDVDSGLPFYAQFIEFGTTNRQHKSGKSVGRVAAEDHAFLRISLYESESQVKALFISTLRAWLREFARGV